VRRESRGGRVIGAKFQLIGRPGIGQVPARSADGAPGGRATSRRTSPSYDWNDASFWNAIMADRGGWCHEIALELGAHLAGLPLSVNHGANDTAHRTWLREWRPARWAQLHRYFSGHRAVCP